MILATSRDPLREPFERQKVFSPVFSHEPDAIVGPRGEVVVMLTHATRCGVRCALNLLF